MAISTQTQTGLETNIGHNVFLKIQQKKQKSKGQTSQPYGIQGLHLFFHVTLSGSESLECSGRDGESQRVKRPWLGLQHK